MGGALEVDSPGSTSDEVTPVDEPAATTMPATTTSTTGDASSTGDAPAEEATSREGDEGSSGSADSSSGGEARGADPTPGCGLEPGGIVNGVIEVGGVQRTYVLQLPRHYDAQSPYPIVFGFHANGGAAELSADLLHVHESWGGEVIAVYLQGLVAGGVATWNLATGGPDFAFFDALYEEIGAQLCVDQSRVYAQGHSRGAMMSSFLACHRGSIIDGIGVHAGRAPAADIECHEPIAAFVVHGRQDTVVPFSAGEQARDRWLALAGCEGDGKPGAQEDCTEWTDCDGGVPVTFCAHDGGHPYQGWVSDQGAAFLQALQP
jgi:poly(3-hydroxybutyrate) depolymerase